MNRKFCAFSLILLSLGLVSIVNIGQGADLTRPKGQQEKECRVQNCHGLEIQCGFSEPKVCTEMYQLGDFCRAFAECRFIKGECQFVNNDLFQGCKDCVLDCERNKDEINPFICEVKCRKEFEPYIYGKPLN